MTAISVAATACHTTARALTAALVIPIDMKRVFRIELFLCLLFFCTPIGTTQGHDLNAIQCSAVYRFRAVLCAIRDSRDVWAFAAEGRWMIAL